MKTVSFATLGCKVNQYETEAMANLFEKAGYKVQSFDDICDIYVINTCTVTGTGERKSRQMINRAHKKNPNAFIAVAGCYSQVSPEAAAALEGVSLVIGTRDRSRIVELCEDAMEKSETTVSVGDIMKQRTYEDMWVPSYSDKTRAFVKIEDGCTEFCTYCIIPYARGPVRSRSMESIVNEVTELAKNGFREIVLTGIHLASYGRDNREYSLLDVIKAIDKIDGICRIRLGSVEPRLLTEDFVREISRLSKVCNHFHVALQSGCDATLQRMNRKYTTAQYKEGIELLRKYFDNPAIATDIMVGFPGETEEEFVSSVKFASELKLADAHVFAYSNRKGTKADRFPCQVPKRTKEERSRIMIDTLAKSREEYLSSQIGKKVQVLMEQEMSKGLWEGHMTNYVKVVIPSDEDLSGKFVDVITESVQKDFVFGNRS